MIFRNRFTKDKTYLACVFLLKKEEKKELEEKEEILLTETVFVTSAFNPRTHCVEYKEKFAMIISRLKFDDHANVSTTCSIRNIYLCRRVVSA